MKPYELIIDFESCWGCRTCEVACKQENRDPDGVRLIKVTEEGPKIVDDRPAFRFVVNVCRHCEEPACMPVCPEEAISVRNDGIVVLDADLCIGCGLCVDECPYDAIEMDDAKGIARKCNLCFERVKQGLIPACADNVCLGHCIYFGEPDEIRKEIEQKHLRRSGNSVSGAAPGG